MKTEFLAFFLNFRFQRKAGLFLSSLCLGANLAWADNLNTLDLFLKNTKLASADFVQTAVSPGKSSADGKPIQKSAVSSGYFAFKRPDRKSVV